jgi:hypothetical protein
MPLKPIVPPSGTKINKNITTMGCLVWLIVVRLLRLRNLLSLVKQIGVTVSLFKSGIWGVTAQLPRNQIKKLIFSQ